MGQGFSQKSSSKVRGVWNRIHHCESGWAQISKGRLAVLHQKGSAMTKMRRFVAVMIFLGTAAWISTALQGQPSPKGSVPAAAPQVSPGSEVSKQAEATNSRFSAPEVITYQAVKGDIYFALPVQPKLEAQPTRARDIVIMLSTAATQGGASWIAGHQIAEAVIDAARDGDRVSLWTANAQKDIKNLTK